MRKVKAIEKFCKKFGIKAKPDDEFCAYIGQNKIGYNFDEDYLDWLKQFVDAKGERSTLDWEEWGTNLWYEWGNYLGSDNGTDTDSDSTGFWGDWSDYDGAYDPWSFWFDW